MAEYCVVFVDSDGWSFKDMEEISDDLEYAKREAVIRQEQTRLPTLGVAERVSQRLIFRTDGGSLELEQKYVVDLPD